MIWVVAATRPIFSPPLVITADGAIRPFSVLASGIIVPVPPSTVLVKRGARALSAEKSRFADRYGNSAPPQAPDGVKESRNAVEPRSNS